MMIPNTYYTYALCLLLAWLVTRLLVKKPAAANHIAPRNNKLPPGPARVPVFGNLFQLGPKLHQYLAGLAAVHGPVMSLRLGSLTVVVVSTSTAVKDVISENDVALSNRGIYDANCALDHDKFSIIWLPNVPRWRNLRKIAATHMFSGASLESSHHLRQRKVADLVSYVDRCAASGDVVDVGEAAFNVSLNFLSNTILSMDFADPSSSRSVEFKQLMRDLALAIGKPNLADYFPILRPLDPQGIRRRVGKCLQKLMDFMDGVIADRLAGNSAVSPESESDMLGILLKLSRQENTEITRTFIIHILIDFFSGGTDTSSTTLEFAMAYLVRHPDKMRKLREELDAVIGRSNAINESDIDRLPYLQGVFKEALRLHPPLPLASRRTVDTLEVAGGYVIPKGARVWANLWAIGRDPNVWPDPLSFEPERHSGSEFNFKGKNFELIPFGSGRRICPGMPLVMRMAPVVLGSLVHSFDWNLENDAEPGSLDMEEVFGLSIQKAVPLRAIPVRV